MPVKKKKRQQKAIRANRPTISRKRLWVFRLITVIVIPVLFFGCLEMGLRLFGAGYPTKAMLKRKVGERQVYCPNLQFGWRFFPKNIAREFDGFVFEIEKSPKTYRIFVLGASAAMGTPDPTYNFGRFIEVMLADKYPEVKFEVITAAMTAINSHVVLPIAKDCAGHNPDLFIVYLGNNEVIGPYGTGTVFAPVSSNLAAIRTGIAIQSTRTGQLLGDLLSVIRPPDKALKGWGGMEMFLEKQVRSDSDALQIVYSHYERNLRDICTVGIQAGASVIVSNVAGNLKDNPPFASLHRENLTVAEKQSWKNLYHKGIQYQTQGSFQRALEKYQMAEQVDETFADLQFRMGRCYWNLGEYQKAQKKYIQACDYDTLRFRADTKINQIIRSVSENKTDRRIYFVDTIKTIRENSPHNIPGNEVFYEHVHYNFQGNYLLAGTLLFQIEEILPDWIKQQKTKDKTLTLQQLKSRFVYTGFEQYHTTQYLIDNIFRGPPFSNQLYHENKMKEMDEQLKYFEVYTQPSHLKEIVQAYNHTVTRHPADWRMHWKFGDVFYLGEANYKSAKTEYKKVIEYFPYDRAYYKLMLCCNQLNELEEAERYGKKLLQLQPLHMNAHFLLGDICLKKEDYTGAIKHYAKILQMVPGRSIEPYGKLAIAFDKIGKTEKAIDTLYAAIENFPVEQTAKIHAYLGILLGKQGRNQEAIRIIRKTITTFPPEKIVKEDETFSLLLKLNQIEMALELYHQVLKIKPNSVVLLNDLAWIEATCEDEKIRNVKEAVKFAERACALTDYKAAGTLDTLAAAYAAARDFEKAVTTAGKAIRTAEGEGQMQLTEEIRKKLALYKKGLPYYEKARQ